MVFGVIFGLTGFGLILGHTEGEFNVGFHQIVGVVCLSLSVVQPLIGCIRPPVGTTVRSVLHVESTKAYFVVTVYNGSYKTIVLS